MQGREIGSVMFNWFVAVASHNCMLFFLKCLLSVEAILFTCYLQRFRYDRDTLSALVWS